MPTVTDDNIAAASDIRARLHSWDAADEALARLGRHFPSNAESADVLAKASAIDKLYSTRAGNVYWVSNAAIAALEEAHRRRSDGEPIDCAEVVNLFSHHKRRLYKGSDRCSSFASKYCHFFVSGWEFPIYDSYALAAVNNLLGSKQYGLTPKRTEYRDFCERVSRLRARDGLEHVNVRDLDRYLWLWGQWLFQQGKPKPEINLEVYDIFHSVDPDTRLEVEALRPLSS
jgi:hypothetical protein